MISDYVELHKWYLWEAKIDIGTEWICNPAKLDFPPNPQGSSVVDQRHERWLNFLIDVSNMMLAKRLMRNEYSLDKWQKMKINNGLEFDIEMKGIDKVEQDFLPNIQKLTQKKETYDRLKLWEIFELQRSKHLESDRSDPTMSWLPGTTLHEKFDFFVKRAKDENFLKILDEIPYGKFDYSFIP